MESILFSVSLALCEKFPAFTPFAVYRESFHDVMCLFEDLKQEQDTTALWKANGGKVRLPVRLYMAIHCMFPRRMMIGFKDVRKWQVRM